MVCLSYEDKLSEFLDGWLLCNSGWLVMATMGTCECTVNVIINHLLAWSVAPGSWWWVSTYVCTCYKIDRVIFVGLSGQGKVCQKIAFIYFMPSPPWKQCHKKIQWHFCRNLQWLITQVMCSLLHSIVLLAYSILGTGNVKPSVFSQPLYLRLHLSLWTTDFSITVSVLSGDSNRETDHPNTWYPLPRFLHTQW